MEKTIAEVYAAFRGHGFDVLFWGSVWSGIILSLVYAQDRLTKRQITMTVAAGLFCGIFLTAPIITFFKLDSAVFENAVAALLALGGEHFVRRILKFARSGKITDIKGGLK